MKLSNIIFLMSGASLVITACGGSQQPTPGTLPNGFQYTTQTGPVAPDGHGSAKNPIPGTPIDGDWQVNPTASTCNGTSKSITTSTPTYAWYLFSTTAAASSNPNLSNTSVSGTSVGTGDYVTWVMDGSNSGKGTVKDVPFTFTVTPTNYINPMSITLASPPSMGTVTLNLQPLQCSNDEGSTFNTSNCQSSTLTNPTTSGVVLTFSYTLSVPKAVVVAPGTVGIPSSIGMATGTGVYEYSVLQLQTPLSGNFLSGATIGATVIGSSSDVLDCQLGTAVSSIVLQ